jgi:hypothetical protein
VEVSYPGYAPNSTNAYQGSRYASPTELPGLWSTLRKGGCGCGVLVSFVRVPLRLEASLKMCSRSGFLPQKEATFQMKAITDMIDQCKENEV